jgi:hypothetical protein
VIAKHAKSHAVASVLLENRGLVHAGLPLDRMEALNQIMTAISTHPTIRTLHFRGGGGSSEYMKRARTKTVADMLLVNKHIDIIPFSWWFDRGDWNTLVAPRIEYILYRKRFVTIQKIEGPSSRATAVARSLAGVERNPSLVCMVLSQNHDVVCSYLGEARDDCVSFLLRKRR